MKAFRIRARAATYAEDGQDPRLATRQQGQALKPHIPQSVQVFLSHVICQLISLLRGDPLGQMVMKR